MNCLVQHSVKKYFSDKSLCATCPCLMQIMNVIICTDFENISTTFDTGKIQHFSTAKMCKLLENGNCFEAF